MQFERKRFEVYKEIELPSDAPQWKYWRVNIRFGSRFYFRNNKSDGIFLRYVFLHL